MDGNNNSDDMNLNVKLGVEEDKGVGAKINTFKKKLGIIPEEREVKLRTRADFRKTNADLNKNLKRWQKVGKHQAGNPVANYFFGDKNKVRATKQLFVDLEKTARRSTNKYNNELNAMLGTDRKPDKNGNFFGFGGEIGETRYSFHKAMESRRVSQKELNKLTETYNILLQKQNKLSLMNDEKSTMQDMEKQRANIKDLEHTRDKEVNDAFDTVQPMKVMDIGSEELNKKDLEVLKLAGGYFSRTNGNDTLYKQIEKDIRNSIKNDEEALKNVAAALRKANGKTGGLQGKLNRLLQEQKKSPSEETSKKITDTKTAISKNNADVKKYKRDELIGKKYLSIDQKRMANYQEHYNNRNKPQDFANDKNYKTEEFPAKFDKAMRSKTSTVQEMVNSIGKLTTPKSLDDINNKINAAYDSMAKLQVKMQEITAKKANNNVDIGYNDNDDTISKELKNTKQSMKESEAEIAKSDKSARKLLITISRLRDTAKDFSRQLKLINDDTKINPFKHMLESDDLSKYNDKVDDIKTGVESVGTNWKKSNVFTRLVSRMLINIRSQIADMFNPFTKFRQGFDQWLNRWNNLALKNTFEVIGYNLVTAFEPIFEMMAKVLIFAAQIANVFTKKLANVDLFDKSAWSLEQINKGVGQLTASFDELHSTTDNPDKFNTIFDKDNDIKPLDAGLENKLTKLAEGFGKAMQWIIDNPVQAALAALAIRFLGPMLLKGLGSLVVGGIKKLLTGGEIGGIVGKAGKSLGNLLGTGIQLPLMKNSTTIGKALGGIALIAGGTALAISNAASAGKNWEDLTDKQKAVKIGFVGLGSAAAGLGAIMLGASGPVGWAVAGTVALTSFVVGMSQTQDGINSVKKETEQWKKAQQDMNIALAKAGEADNNYEQSLMDLKDTEAAYNESGKEVFDMVEKGILTTDNMTFAQLKVYNAYKKTQKALEEQTAARKEANEAVRNEAKEHADVLIANGRENKSYDELAKHINDCWKNGTMTTETARDEISRAMAGMSESARTEFLEKLQPALQQGLDYEKYQSGWNEFGRFWEQMWTNAVGVHDQSIANMKATEEDLLQTTDTLTDAQKKLTDAQNELSLAEQNAGITFEALNNKLTTGELSVNNLTEAQRKLYEAHIKVDNSAASVDIALAKNEENLVGITKKTYESGGEWTNYVNTLNKAAKDGQISTKTMEKEIGDSLGRLKGKERDYATEWLKQNNLMTAGVQKACDEQKGFFNSLGDAFSKLGQRIGNWFTGKGWNTDSDLIKKQMNSISNNSSLSDEQKRQKLTGLVNSYDVGTNYVPNDQLAMIHQGEAIIPAKYNKPYTPQGNSNLDGVISAMTQEIANLRTLVQQGIPVKGEFKQRGSDLVAVVEKGKNKNGNQPLSNPAYAR